MATLERLGVVRFWKTFLTQKRKKVSSMKFGREEPMEGKMNVITEKMG